MVATTPESMPEAPMRPAAMETTTATIPTTTTTTTKASTDNLGADPVNTEPLAFSPYTRDPRVQEFTPSCGLAIFSTELGTQAKREINKTCLPAVIVRSDSIKGVVDASRYWQARFKVQCLCIFPGQGWMINDLWDAFDLHLDTPDFCTKMLTFISRDTYYAARKFADDWIRAYPKRLAVVGSDMAELYNPHDAFAIVDKIYNEGERAAFPRTFLWHVAHMMRHTLLEMQSPTEMVAAAIHLQNPLHIQHQNASKLMNHNTPNMAKLGSSQKVEIKTAKRTASIEKSLAAAISSKPQHSKMHVPCQEWPLSRNRHAEPEGNVSSSMNSHPITSPIISNQSLRVMKSQSRNMAAAAYQQAYPYSWIESAHCGGFGHYPRQPSGGIPHMQSPRFIPSNMTIVQPTMAAGYIPSYSHGPPIMSANMASMQPAYTNIAQNGLAYHPTTIVSGSNGAFAHHPSAVRGVSMSDMTETGHYPSSLNQHNMDQRTLMPRRGSKHNSNGTLYDPYNGTNSDFCGANGFSKGKKHSHNDNVFLKDRPRNVSGSGARPGYAGYSNDRVASISHSGGRYMGYSRIREQFEDDPSITEDRVTGCHEFWIGPENVTVTELFLGDLPVDVQLSEVMTMLEKQTSISPANVSIRFPAKTDRPPQQHERCHAFVSLKSSADAKKIMSMRDREFRLREDANPVMVSVPRRFFQSIPNSVRRASSTSGPGTTPLQNGKADGRDGHKITRLSTRDGCKTTGVADTIDSGVKKAYSPQNARRGLQNKTEENSGSNDAGVARSTPIHPRKFQNSPTEKIHAKKGNRTLKPDTADSLKDAIVDTVSTGTATVGMAVGNGNPILDLAQSSATTTTPDSLEPTVIEDTARRVSEKASFDNETSNNTEHSIQQTSKVVGTSESDSGDVKARPSVKLSVTTSNHSEDMKSLFVSGQPNQLNLEGIEQSIASSSADTERSLVTNEYSVTDIESVAGPTEGTSKYLDLAKQKVFSHATSQEEQPAQPMLPAISADSSSAADSGGDPQSHDKTFSCTVTKSSTNSVAHVPDKPGLQQVASLHPYAKPSKSQQKKAKEALRKQQKKELAEKASKSKTKSHLSTTLRNTNEAAVPGEGLVVLQSAPDQPVLGSKSNTQSPNRLETSPSRAENTKPSKKTNESFSKCEGENHKLLVLADAAMVARDRLHQSQNSFDVPGSLIDLSQQAPMGDATVVSEYVDEAMVRNDKLVQHNGSGMMNSQDISCTPVPMGNLVEPVTDDPARLAPKKRSKNKRKKARTTMISEDKGAVGDAHGKKIPVTAEGGQKTHKAIKGGSG